MEQVIEPAVSARLQVFGGDAFGDSHIAASLIRHRLADADVKNRALSPHIARNAACNKRCVETTPQAASQLVAVPLHGWIGGLLQTGGARCRHNRTGVVCSLVTNLSLTVPLGIILESKDFHKLSSSGNRTAWH